jgi:hypothetical protein
MSKLTSLVKKSASEAALAIVLVLLPAVVVLLKLPETTLAGCPPYGYSCNQVACFALEVKTSESGSWTDGSVYIYAYPSSQPILVKVRTVMSVLSGSIQGWSFGVRHDASQLEAAGGQFSLVALEEGSFSTVKCGSQAPDLANTRARHCGFTQGVLIDTGTTDCKLQAPAELVTATLCYRIVAPSGTGVYPVTLQFTNDVGSPPIDSIVTQGGQSKVPCKFDLTLNVYSSSYYQPTPGFCDLQEQNPIGCFSGDGDGDGGGAGGGPSLEEMVDQGVAFLLGARGSSACSDPNDPKDRWNWPSFPHTVSFMETVATTAICAEAVLSAPGYDESPERKTAILSATQFLLQNANSSCDQGCASCTNPQSVACEDQAWVAFPLQFLIRLQELDRIPQGITVELVRTKTLQLVDALLDCINTNDHRGLSKYFSRANPLLKVHSPFKTALALLVLKRVETFSANHPDHPYCFTAERRTRLRRALDALYASRVCGEIADNPTPFTTSCDPCPGEQPEGCAHAVCVTPCLVGNCGQPCTAQDCAPPGCRKTHGGSFTYADRRLASTGQTLAEEPERATVPGSAGRTPISEAALHAWGWPPELDGTVRKARLSASLDAFFDEGIYGLYLASRREGHSAGHVDPYGIAAWYFMYAHYSVAMAIELLPASERPLWREKLVEKLRAERGVSVPQAFEPNPSGWNDAMGHYGTGMALLALLASNEVRLGPCQPLAVPVVFKRGDFKRGDTDGDGTLTVTDAIRIFNFLFFGATVGCKATLDADDDHRATITDGIFLFNYLFRGGPAPPAPHPSCGVDPVPGPFDCADYPPCTGTNLSQLPADYQSEGSVAINPCTVSGGVENVFVVSMHWPGGSSAGPGLFRAVSWDGGESWLTGVILESGAEAALADPWAAFDKYGNLYLTYIGVDDLVHLVISSDGGRTFPLHTIFNSGGDQPVIATGPAFDDPNVTGDEDQASVWIVWRGATPGQPRRLVAVGARVTGLFTCSVDSDPTLGVSGK